MGVIFGILAGLAGLVSLVCLILVLIKLFQSEGILYGILGIICGIYAFIWGWMHKDEHDLGQIMLYWTGAIVASVVFNVIFGVMSA